RDSSVDNTVTYGSFAARALVAARRRRKRVGNICTKTPIWRFVMPHRPLAILLSQLVLLAFVGASVAEAQTAPALKSAVSRKVQGGQSFDVALPLAGGSGIEPRSGNSFAVVMTFDQ